MKKEKSLNNYYVGLDIGTNSVGYAVTDENYSLLKFKGEDMWGSHLFDSALNADERRAFRSDRRRLDRRQLRVNLIGELFSKEIFKVDKNFFVRRQSSFIYAENAEDKYRIFATEEENQNYKEKYFTIHHLISELMNSKEPHDVRLVYLACAWLVAHRGHFLSEVSKENVSAVKNFKTVYDSLVEFLQEDGKVLPWDDIDIEEFGNIISEKIGTKAKYDKIKDKIFGGKKLPKNIDEENPYNYEVLIKLLCCSKCKMSDLFGKEEYSDFDSIALNDSEEKFEEILTSLEDEDAELLLRLKNVYDWSLLKDILQGAETISEAKVAVFEQHKNDLRLLKDMIKKYNYADYKNIFRVGGKTDNSNPDKSNYAFYVKHMSEIEKSNAIALIKKDKISKASKEDFSKYLLKIVEKITPEKEDEEKFNDMKNRLSICAFLPKQVVSDNRVIPYQLYWYELDKILKNAENYLPMLSEKDSGGMTVSDKIKSVFMFRVPYFVGPLCTYKSQNAWIERKANGKIYPWNFDELVNLDKSEKNFISRMTNKCTYLPCEDVMPKNSLCYSAFTVLNEINNIKIDDVGISVEAKQEIFNNLFMKFTKVTVKKIKDYLISHNYMTKNSRLAGLDETVKSNLKSFKSFERLYNSKQLNYAEIEDIIKRATYSEDKFRFAQWLDNNYKKLSAEDRRYISTLKFKDFGTLSKRLLCEVYGVSKNSKTGEAQSIMETLWNTNLNFMEIIWSEDFTFKGEIERIRFDYYSSHNKTLAERLEEDRIPNSVKRPIYRTFDILNDIVKAEGQAPKKIFIEMARGADEDQKGRRTKSRYDQLKELYSKVKTEDVRILTKELEEMGDSVENKLQSNKLFLRYLQLGKCLYTGDPIPLESILKGDGVYNIEHIWPQSYVKDDSIINNEILVNSQKNGDKSDKYPVDSEIQSKMKNYWSFLNSNGLMSDEKYKRLTRTTHFTESEKNEFINRQLVETRQSTKEIKNLLVEKYPDTEIVCVKAKLVSDFRQEFEMIKSRTVNDLHHAKDAYLNIVVGNVYNSKFNKKYFSVETDKYNLKIDKVFEYQLKRGNNLVWKGNSQIGEIKHIVARNTPHLTKYAFCRSGGLFDQNPVRAKEGLTPLKKDLPTEIYGGYNKSTASFFVLVKYRTGNKTDIMVTPIELMYKDKFLNNRDFADNYVREQIETSVNKKVDDFEILLNRRILKINTVFSLDGFLTCLSGKTGEQLGISNIVPFKCGKKEEDYIKHLESLSNKVKINSNFVYNQKYDKISKEENMDLYNCFVNKLNSFPYNKRPNQKKTLQIMLDGKDKFEELSIFDQTKILLGVLGIMNRENSCDLTLIGGVKSTGVATLNSKISNWTKSYKDVRILNISPSGLHSSSSENILDLL